MKFGTIINGLMIVAIGFMLTGCLGYKAKDSELTGQVKKVVSVTPLLCPNLKVADISLGVMRNGVGSMSSEDVWIYIQNDKDFDTLTAAVATGALVKIKYDVARMVFCVPDYQATHVELTQ